MFLSKQSARGRLGKAISLTLMFVFGLALIVGGAWLLKLGGSGLLSCGKRGVVGDYGGFLAKPRSRMWGYGLWLLHTPIWGLRESGTDF